MPRVSNFADIINIATMYIKRNLNLNIVKIISNYVLLCNLFLYFLIYANVRRTQEIFHVSFFIHLYLKYNCAKYYHCRICVKDFKERVSFCFPSMRNAEEVHPE